jgi:membrane protease YdiL (CAAX protease family)
MAWDFWLIFLILGVLIPWRGHARLKRLLAQPAVSTKDKMILYGGTIAVQWVLVGVVAWRAFARGLTMAELGLARHVSAELLLFGLSGAVFLGALQWLNLRRIGRMTGPVPDFTRQLAKRILPDMPIEFAPYFTLAVTAGICEEFLYRGFAMATLSRAGIMPWAVVIISSVLFGLAHTYQGRSGVFGTTLMGLVFGAARLGLQSLIPVAMWHSAVDIVAGMAGQRYLLPVQENTVSL